jgi:creatinine amidohydrolase
MSEREIRFECLRPGQLLEERDRCPLIFIPVAPLEYHGPHLPVGMDPINATQCALGACRKLGKGVVLPTVYWGTERERPDWMLESLGFKKDEWVVGMDFPTALWPSHYYSEHIFALVLANKIEMMIAHDYKVICIVNGHGAWNHMETIDRLAKHYSNTTDSNIIWKLAFLLDVSEKNLAGHADVFETSLMMHYQDSVYNGSKLVDIGELPPSETPIRYPDFSIVDGAGFSENPSPGKVVQTDPREASAEKGKQIYEDTISMYATMVEEALSEKGLA